MKAYEIRKESEGKWRKVKESGVVLIGKAHCEALTLAILFHSLLQVWKMYLRRLRSTVLQVREVMLKMSSDRPSYAQCHNVMRNPAVSWYINSIYQVIEIYILYIYILKYIEILLCLLCLDVKCDRIRRTGTNLQERSCSPAHFVALRWSSCFNGRISLISSRKTHCRPQHLQGESTSVRLPTFLKHSKIKLIQSYWIRFNPYSILIQSLFNLSHV